MMTTLRSIVVRVAVVAGLLPGQMALVIAHDSHEKPQFGGIVMQAKDYELELVLKPGLAILHVTEHGKPVRLTGASAKVTVLAGTLKSDLTMTLKDGRFEAGGDIANVKGTKAIAAVVIPGKGTYTARFEVK
jgi:hypothetical protein